MSIVLTRSPLEPIGMNGGGAQKRRSARLSQEGDGENEPPTKRARVNETAATTTVTTKLQDGEGSKAAGKKKKKVYDVEVDDFTFSKRGKTKKKEPKETVVREKPSSPKAVKGAPPVLPQEKSAPPPNAPAAVEDEPPKTTQKKTRRRLPTSPERDDKEKTVRRSKRLSNDQIRDGLTEEVLNPSPQRPSHAKSHVNTARDRSPSPAKARPVTVEKKRKHVANDVEEEKITYIQLPLEDTPVIRRNKEMRKTSAEGHRRSSAGMRGKRASSLMDEGRGHEASRGSTASPTPQASEEHDRTVRTPHAPYPSGFEPLSTLSNTNSTIIEDTLADDNFQHIALPHAEVPASEFYKHISADLTEPRRMRCLLGWCGARSLPSKPGPPEANNPTSSAEFQALQAAHIIQEELSQDLMIKGTLSDWFSRDESVPLQIPLRKKANPRNVTNAAKAEELERELERLKSERAQWKELEQAASASSRPELAEQPEGSLSPIRPDVLDSPDRTVLEQLQVLPPDPSGNDPAEIQRRLKTISEDLEFAVDQFAHGVHVLSTTRETAERVADKSLANAANALEEREKQRATSGKPVDQIETLRGLARVLNARYKS